MWVRDKCVLPTGWVPEAFVRACLSVLSNADLKGVPPSWKLVVSSINQGLRTTNPIGLVLMRTLKDKFKEIALERIKLKTSCH